MAKVRFGGGSDLPFVIGGFIVLGLLLLCVYAAQDAGVRMALFAVVGAVIFVGTIMSPEFGLYVLLFSFLLSPEITLGGPGAAAGAGIEAQRAVVIRVEDLLLFVLITAWFLKTGIRKELGILVKTPVNRPVFALIFISVLSTMLGVILYKIQSPMSAFFYVLKYVEYYVVFFMVINHVTREDQIRRLLITALIVCAIVCVHAYYQIPSGERVSAPFEGKPGEPNTLGGYLVFMLAIVMGLFLETRSDRLRIFFACFAVFIFVPLMYTQSRSSYLATVPMAFALLFLTRRKLLMTSIILVAVVVAWLKPPAVVEKRMRYTFEQEEYAGQVYIGGVRIDTSASDRVTSWKNAIAELARRPQCWLTGFGITGLWFLDAQYVRTLCETGILGLLIFLWLLLALFREARRVQSAVQEDVHRAIALGYMAGLVGLMVHALGANTFIVIRIMEPFWFFTGLVLLMPVLEEEARLERSAPPPPKVRAFLRPSFVPS